MANFRLYTRSSEKLAQNMQAEMMASCSAYRFQDVPIQVIADAVRTFLKQIQTRLRPPYRQKMFENIMADVPAEFASEAAWEKPLPPRRDQNTKVKTPFSEPKKVSSSPAIPSTSGALMSIDPHIEATRIQRSSDRSSQPGCRFYFPEDS